VLRLCRLCNQLETILEPAQECHFPPDNFFTSNGEEEEEEEEEMMHARKN